MIPKLPRLRFTRQNDQEKENQPEETGVDMRLRSLGLTFVLAVLALVFVAGCSGGGGGTPPTPVTITTTTLTQGTVNSSFSATLAATGGSGTYTWSVSSGNLPTGLTLSSAGAITGTPTTAGLSSFTVQAEDSESTPQSGTQALKLAISGGNLTITSIPLQNGQVGQAYTFPLTAKGGVPPYTWSIDSSNPLPSGLTLASAVISGSPATAGNYSVGLSVTDAGNNTSEQTVPLNIGPSGSSLPTGTYSFIFSGTGPHGAIALNGGFLLQPTSAVGFYDENISSTGSVTNQNITGITLVPGTNGLSQLKLQLATGGSVTFALAAPASIVTSGNDTDVRMIEFDDTTGSGTRGSGVLKVSNGATTTSSIVNNYAFSLSGVDSSQNPVAVVGSFSADSKGNITGYGADENDSGAMTKVGAFTGTYGVDTVRGTMQFMWNGNTYHYSFYPVAPNELFLISLDTVAANIPLLSGVVEQQTGTFSAASLKGAGVLELNGLASLSGELAPDVTLGVATGNGAGNITVAYDEYKGQLLSPQSFTGTYAVTAASGRVALSSSGTPAVLYLLDTNEAFVLGGDASASTGLLEPQSGTSFSNSSFKGNYLGGSLPLDSPAAMNEVDLAVPDGNGNIALTYNNSGPKGLATNQSTSGTYSVGSNGRIVVKAADGTTRIFYVVSPTEAVLLSGEGNGYLGSLEQ
jgi:Putative Ig domain